MNITFKYSSRTRRPIIKKELQSLNIVVIACAEILITLLGLGGLSSIFSKHAVAVLRCVWLPSCIDWTLNAMYSFIFFSFFFSPEAEIIMPPNNPMTVWGNEKTMNLNTLVLTNIQSSPYFKVNLFELKTYHEVIDEIYYKVRISFCCHCYLVFDSLCSFTKLY